jgi:hypothetical protein
MGKVYGYPRREIRVRRTIGRQQDVRRKNAQLILPS